MGLMSKLSNLFQPEPAPATAVSHALATLANTVPQLAALPGSKERLLPGIQHALAYYQQIAAAIPGPIGISASRHGADDVLDTLFPGAQDMAQSLGRSLAVRNSLNWFVDHGRDTVVGVLGMRTRNVGNGSTRFVDHTIRSLGSHAQDTRECLCEAALTSLVKAFASQSNERQRQWRLAHTGAAIQRELDPEGAQITDTAAREEPTAERELDALAACLMAPEAQMRLEDDHEHPSVAWPGNGSDPLRLPAMATSDRRTWLVCLVEFPLQEALRAVEQETLAHRYILI